MPDDFREKVRAAISNAYYDARNNAQTMERAADNAADAVMSLIGFWTPDEWAEWSNELALLIPDGDESRYSNPEGAQEGIIQDCLAAYVAERNEVSS